VINGQRIIQNGIRHRPHLRIPDFKSMKTINWPLTDTRESALYAGNNGVIRWWAQSPFSPLSQERVVNFSLCAIEMRKKQNCLVTTTSFAFMYSSLPLAGEAEVTELCMAHESTPMIKPLALWELPFSRWSPFWVGHPVRVIWRRRGLAPLCGKIDGLVPPKYI